MQAKEFKPRGCVFCEEAHRPSECPNVKDVKERKQILVKKTTVSTALQETIELQPAQARAPVRTARRDTIPPSARRNSLLTTNTKEGVMPIVVVKVNGITCRALIDTEAGSSYISAKMISILKLKPYQTTIKNIEMLMSTKQMKGQKFKAKLSSDYELDVDLTKVDRHELLSVDNPRYEELQRRYPYLRPVEINDTHTKPHLPVHLVLGAGEYTRIKTAAKPLVGREGEPIAEKTKLRWFIMSPGIEVDTLLFAKSSQKDYEELCRLDVLGLSDSAEHSQQPTDRL